MAPFEAYVTKPSDLLIKELYARFGLAYYEAECLHRGLCNAYALAPFAAPDGITGPRVDERLCQAFAMTLGQVVEALAPWTLPALQQTLTEAVERRNYLAHHFWFERCHLALTEEGVVQLLRDLTTDADLFARADREVQAQFAHQSERLGVTEDMCRAALEGMIEGGEKWQDLPLQRRLKKLETIVRVWDAPTPDGGLALIFELEDGSLWQLSDVGLGWTRFSTTRPDWVENAQLKPYLPARTNPRPGPPGSWEYQLALGTGATVSVRLSRKRAKTYLWSLRTEGKPSERPEGD